MTASASATTIIKKGHRVVTVLFTDIEGSTERISRVGSEEAYRIISLHNEAIRKIIEENGKGQVHHFIGDSVFATFSRPSVAISCALAIQRAIHELNQEHQINPPLKVRIGLHEGELLLDELKHGEAVSPHINCAQRVMSVADGGQILVTQAVYDMGREFVNAIPQEHLAWAYYGPFVLRGIGPVDLYEVADKRLRQPKLPALAGERKIHRLKCSGYNVLERLGEGGMGVVYMAEQPVGESRTKVAIKVLGRGLEDNEKARQRFIQEADTIAKLDHPGIVKVKEICPENDPPFFVMELLCSKTIVEAAQNYDWRGKAMLLAKVCEAIDYAHQQKVIHRDLKPHNILVRSNGLPVVLDFGLQLVFDPEASRISDSSALLGSPLYFSPEQARGDRNITPSADIYALGVILYEILVGRPPFVGATLHEILNAHLYDDPKLPAVEKPDVPDGLQRVCLKALEKHPSDRYASATAMAEDLRRFARDERVMVRPRIFDNLIGSRVQKHMTEITTWHRERLLTNFEYASLIRAYRHFTRSGLAAVMEPRMLHLWLLIVYMGGWLILNGAGLWLVISWNDLRSWAKILLGFLPTVITNSLWVIYWRAGRYRAAFMMMVLAVLSLPDATGVFLHETGWFHSISINAASVFTNKPNIGLSELELSYGQWFIISGFSLAWAMLLAYTSSTTTISALAVIFGILSYAILLDLDDLSTLASEHQATFALRCIPAMLACLCVGFVFAKTLKRPRQSSPWFATALVLLIWISQTIAWEGPRQWQLIMSAHTEQVQGALVALCGLCYLWIGAVLRRRLPVDAHEAYSCLLWVAPLSFLGGLGYIASNWPSEWIQIPIFAKSIPLPDLLFLTASITTVLVASRVQVKFYVLAGLLSTAWSVWNIGMRYFKDSKDWRWPIVFLLIGLIVTAVTVLVELRHRHPHVSEDIDDVAERLLKERPPSK